LKLARLLRIIFSIILVVFSPLHALSGAAQGALLSRENPGQGALYGAIGAAGGEVAMEAVYDPKARSEAISEGMKARMARGELAQMLAEAGVELPQLDQGGEQTLGDGSQPLAHAGSRQGVLTRSQARTQQEMSELFKAQVEAGLEQVFIKNLRADVERSRNLVRVGMSGVALAAGTDGAQMSMMDLTASRATEENFFLQAIGIGLAVWETVRIVGESLDVCQKEGVGAALAHAGVETAKEVALAVTGVKVIKLAGKALKLAKGSKIVGKVGEKIASALPEAVGGLVPDAVKTTVQQAGTLVKKGAEAVGKLDRKLDTAVSTQVQKLRGRGATAGAGQSISAPQNQSLGQSQPLNFSASENQHFLRQKFISYLKTVHELPQEQVFKDIKGLGFERVQGSKDGITFVKFSHKDNELKWPTTWKKIEEKGGIPPKHNHKKIEIHRPDKATPYHHMHIHDFDGYPLDKNLKRVPHTSKAAHIKIQGPSDLGEKK
jgi:hypothetical protein